ncbi:class I SAM-dependent methyltransferase [Halothiobacillus sp.]|uniref:class I SAM-dependent methyltransferase n=1 Tax=Halothiobacillus sp. TaxID=1891311 RepID=UPI002AD2700C|nr:class I SAM-dependent methyltransferase [Halothiobacillus sp.]
MSHQATADNSACISVEIPPSDLLASVLRHVSDSGYRFTTTTPLTHQRMLDHRGGEPGTTLRDVFGWNLPFLASAVPPELLDLMKCTGILVRCGAFLKSAIRIASLDDLLFIHSAFPTTDQAAVFFGPDTYRFVRFVQSHLPAVIHHANTDVPLRLLDIGCGSGAGGIAVACALRRAGLVVDATLNDINQIALDTSALNAQHAGIRINLALGDALDSVAGDFDLIITNPPFLDDAQQRAYRHGGAGLGRALSVRFAANALARLAPGGCLLLYTGVAMLDGTDPFWAELAPLLAASGCDWRYEEIDPDIFGDELSRPIYAHVDRIAAVGLVATRPGGPSDA